MRLWPRSLFGRLLLTLLAILLVAQAATAALYAFERLRGVQRALVLPTAQRVSSAVALLDELNPEGRQRVVRMFSAPPLRLRLTAEAPFPESDTAPSWRETLLMERLRRGLGPERPIRLHIEEREAPPEEASPPPGLEGGGMEGMRAMHRQQFRRLHLFDGPVLRLEMATPLADGGWAHFTFEAPRELFELPRATLVSAAILVVAALLASLLAVRSLVRPLGRLAAAADELGRDIHRPPLKERGPTEVRRAARAFNTMQARLGRYIDERARILAAVSHDLKTPITRMRLRAEMLEGEEIRERLREDLEEMERMVTATLDFMRGLDVKEPLAAMDLDTLLETLKEDLEALGKGEVTLAGRLGHPLRARPLSLKRCLTNVIGNALDYAGGAEVRVGKGGGEVTIRVLDRGPGIPEGELERVFDPFVRLEGSRSRETGGTGLGLGIARNLARAHGGELEVRNREGGGLEARITLPG